MALTRPKLTLTTPARPDTDIAGGAAPPPAAATGQAATVYSATNARQVTRYKAVTTFPVFSVVTT